MTIRHRQRSLNITTLLLLFLSITLLLSSPLVSARRTDIPHKPTIYLARTNAHIIHLHERRADISTRQKTSTSTSKKPEYVAHPAGDLVCRPFGECEPCPRDELDQPFCFPFGNRRLLHCIPSSSAEEAAKGNHVGEVPAWEACGKVVRKERQDFWEFVTANLLFLIVALTILWARTSALATEQYRQLAARIGIPSGGWV
ncbi:uncharacterized protein I303_102056 [Kwoniella dejecticola CBS 10117]|uniref:Uncharacterized protein n=1 Tax=Kwoniella dejecticola CBS 10117 TaxID=1296121 RepID=A0A1A6AC07_9TREE|nr:uncharacterized protein I303_01805 [Kwoniella dejecticola CBS 10117]OBR87597.1 hypothetical protein I303_01805 [Kwoniella dejecticola CBS 10117]